MLPTAAEASPQTPNPQIPSPSSIAPHLSTHPPTTGTGCACVNTCPSTPTSPPPAGSEDLGLPGAQVVRDYQALAIVLPIAMVTIPIIAVIVGVGMALFVRGRGRPR